MPDSYITESYLRRSIEYKALTAVTDILWDLLDRPDIKLLNMAAKYWYSNGNVSRNWSDGHHSQRVFDVHIHDRFYRPGGDVERGDPYDADGGPVTSGEYTVERNHGSTPIKHHANKSITLTESKTSELSEGVELDMTAKQSAGYGGVSAEFEEHLGITVNKTDARTSSEERTAEFGDEVDIPGGKEVVIVYQKTSKRFFQDFTINAISDLAFDLELTWPDINMRHRKDGHLFNDDNHALWSWRDYEAKRKCSFKSLHDFCGFIRGYDPRAPKMAGYVNQMSDSAKSALAKLEDAEILRLVLSGTNDALSEGDADYSLNNCQGVSDGDIDDIFGKDNAPRDLDEARQMLLDARVAVAGEVARDAWTWVGRKRLV